ncbi:MAG: glycosyltransferase family 39 protein [Anaerolineae bacterium]|nr:glycosyltransferase family 39 protein [Anaerolineae bacterium]
MKNRLWLHVLGLFLLLLGLGGYLATTRTFLLSDVGLRFWQVRALLDNGGQSLAVTYPGQVYDPNLQHIPFYFAYALVDGQIFLNITPFVPLAAAGFYMLLGEVGLVIVPVLGTVLTAVAVYLLLRLTNVSGAVGWFWVTAVGTPLFFYALELWDHTPAVACAAWAVYGVSRAVVRERWQPAFWGGVALGVGLGQRPEMYVFALALGLAALVMLWPRRTTAVVLALGALAGAAPLWLWQYQWVGHPLGMALATNLLGYGVPDNYAFEPENVLYNPAITLGRLLIAIQARSIPTFLAGLLVLVGIVVLILALRQDKWRTSRLLLFGLALCLAGYGMYVWVALRPAALHGLITTLPIIAFSLAYVPAEVDNGRYRPIYRFIMAAALLFLGFMLFLWPTSGGLQWGARYLLPITPLLVYLAAYAYQAYTAVADETTAATLRWTLRGLVGIGVLIQLAGLWVQVGEHRLAGELQASIEALPAEVVLTNGPFMAAHLAGVQNKTILYVADEAALAELVVRLAADGVEQIAVVPLAYVPLVVPSQAGNVALRATIPFVYELEAAP